MNTIIQQYLHHRPSRIVLIIDDEVSLNKENNIKAEMNKLERQGYTVYDSRPVVDSQRDAAWQMYFLANASSCFVYITNGVGMTPYMAERFGYVIIRANQAPKKVADTNLNQPRLLDHYASCGLSNSGGWSEQLRIMHSGVVQDYFAILSGPISVLAKERQFAVAFTPRDVEDVKIMSRRNTRLVYDFSIRPTVPKKRRGNVVAVVMPPGSGKSRLGERADMVDAEAMITDPKINFQLRELRAKKDWAAYSELYDAQIKRLFRRSDAATLLVHEKTTAEAIGIPWMALRPSRDLWERNVRIRRATNTKQENFDLDASYDDFKDRYPEATVFTTFEQRNRLIDQFGRGVTNPASFPDEAILYLLEASITSAPLEEILVLGGRTNRMAGSRPGAHWSTWKIDWAKSHTVYAFDGFDGEVGLFDKFMDAILHENCEFGVYVGGFPYDSATLTAVYAIPGYNQSRGSVVCVYRKDHFTRSVTASSVKLLRTQWDGASAVDCLRQLDVFVTLSGGMVSRVPVLVLDLYEPFTAKALLQENQRCVILAPLIEDVLEVDSLTPPCDRPVYMKPQLMRKYLKSTKDRVTVWLPNMAQVVRSCMRMWNTSRITKTGYKNVKAIATQARATIIFGGKPSRANEGDQHLLLRINPQLVRPDNYVLGGSRGPNTSDAKIELVEKYDYGFFVDGSEPGMFEALPLDMRGLSVHALEGVLQGEAFSHVDSPRLVRVLNDKYVLLRNDAYLKDLFIQSVCDVPRKMSQEEADREVSRRVSERHVEVDPQFQRVEVREPCYGQMTVQDVITMSMMKIMKPNSRRSGSIPYDGMAKELDYLYFDTDLLAHDDVPTGEASQTIVVKYISNNIRVTLGMSRDEFEEGRYDVAVKYGFKSIRPDPDLGFEGNRLKNGKRELVSISGHLKNMLLAAHYYPVDFPRYFDQIQNNVEMYAAAKASRVSDVTNLYKTLQEGLIEADVSQSTHLFHNYTDYVLSIEVYILQVKLLGSKPILRNVSYAHARLNEILGMFSVFMDATSGQRERAEKYFL